MNLLDLFYVGFFGVMVYSAVLWLLVYASNRDDVFADPVPSRLPSVTFLVPAYNEEDYVGDTIEALLDLDYPDEQLDIIAINDGSEDGTLQVLERFSDRIDIIDKENTGKADSLNTALERVDTELVASMDADSVPEPDLLRKTVGHFEDERVDGVTPALKVLDPSNWVEKIQWMEYVFQIFLRKVFSLFNVQYVLPGPGSIYRAETVKELGGWDDETLTEDMEIAFRIADSGGLLENSSNAVVWTVPPPSLRALFSQRIRWYRGYMQNFRKYIHMLGSREFGNLGMFLLPFSVLWIVLIVFFLGHFLYNIGFTAVRAVETYLLVGFLEPSFSLNLAGVHFFHLFSVLFLAVGVATTLLSLRVSHEDVRLRERKTHYATFLVIYPLLFAAFWVAAFLKHVAPGEGRW